MRSLAAYPLEARKCWCQEVTGAYCKSGQAIRSVKLLFISASMVKTYFRSGHSFKPTNIYEPYSIGFLEVFQDNEAEIPFNTIALK
ncbi:hypothetical protein QE152_g26579 [Popillia japonica]|uniref:Uncharacterized protein n=1 Tax=Popillia japonica TaxID=7064 RepID=A0AAW1JYA0_POPJA